MQLGAIAFTSIIQSFVVNFFALKTYFTVSIPICTVTYEIYNAWYDVVIYLQKLNSAGLYICNFNIMLSGGTKPVPELVLTCSCHIGIYSLQWRHNGHDNISNHQPHDYLLIGFFRRRSKKTSKLRVTGLRVLLAICAGNSPVPGEFPAQMASNTENVSIWWRHHAHSCFMSNAPYIRQ